MHVKIFDSGQTCVEYEKIIKIKYKIVFKLNLPALVHMPSRKTPRTFYYESYINDSLYKT